MKNYRRFSTEPKLVPLKDGEAFVTAYAKTGVGEKIINAPHTLYYNKEIMFPLFKKEAGSTEFNDHKFYVLVIRNEVRGLIKRVSYEEGRYHVLAINAFTRGNSWPEHRTFKSILSQWGLPEHMIYECDTFESIFELMQDLKSNNTPE